MDLDLILNTDFAKKQDDELRATIVEIVNCLTRDKYKLDARLRRVLCMRMSEYYEIYSETKNRDNLINALEFFIAGVK